MGLVRRYGDKIPHLGEDVFIAENATVIGDVQLGAGANVWYGAVLRADVGWIRIGERSNVQDLVCVHMTTGVSNAEIGAAVTIGHGAIIHGARVGDGALVGMGAILLDNAEIGEESLIAAGTLVTPNIRIPPGSLVRGSPGKVVRALTAEERQQGRLSAEHYIELARQHR